MLEREEGERTESGQEGKEIQNKQKRRGKEEREAQENLGKGHCPSFLWCSVVFSIWVNYYQVFLHSISSFFQTVLTIKTILVL